MRPRLFELVRAPVIVLVCGSWVVSAVAGERVHTTKRPGDFVLVENGRAAPIAVDPDDHEVVRLAAGLFAEDVERVSGVKPAVVNTDAPTASEWVIIGSIDRSRLIRKLRDAGKIDVDGLEGRWESFRVTTVDRPLPGVRRAVVIVGSDRRGTAFGVFDLSEAIGVSPWYFWADVPVERRGAIYLDPGVHREGPPSVKYRGIFLNDEDWGLQPWAAQTFEPEVGDIGPKTYARIFELLLRLKANYIWPAMHPSTRAFNYYERNKFVADRYAIVMGSSHAEPMLRNNVDEWARDGSGDWNFVTNREAVLRYWEQRVAENARFENLYTMGMRGIHDSRMQGGGDVRDRARVLEEIFAAQRDMLERHTGQPAERVPQVFVPYKEVLEIYRSGLEVPPDVTLGWIDDNYGYIRQLPDAEERARPGGSGVYFHVSYWGRPLDYLWIDSMPPGLIWEEMTKAAEFGADRMWVLNVGDIKPNEQNTDWFLRLAWDTDAWGPDDVTRGMVAFFQENFGATHADDIAHVMAEYYRLNHPRKPEHMGWNRVYPHVPVRNSDLSHWAHGDEAQRRLDAFDRLQARAESLYQELPDAYRDAYFQLVLYPVRGAADMNRKLLHAEKSRLLAARGWPAANRHARRAEEAHARILENTRLYNNGIAGGKWRGMMDEAPRDLPMFGKPRTGRAPATGPAGLDLRVEGKAVPARPVSPRDTGEQSPPEVIHLGADDAQLAGALRTLDTPAGPALTLPQAAEDRIQGPDGEARAGFEFHVASTGRYTLRFEVNHPADTADSWHIIPDDGDPITWNDRPTGGDWRWFDVTDLPLSAGRHRLTIVAREDGAQLRRIAVAPQPTTAAMSHPALTQQPNRLPTLSRYTDRAVFLDLYNTGGGTVSWEAHADRPWVRLGSTGGSFEAHRRIEVSVDFDRAPREADLTASLTVTGAGSTYRLQLPVHNPDVAVAPGAFVEENGAIAIHAEGFARTRPGADDSRWRTIENVGYSGACVGVFPRLIQRDLPLPPEAAPTLSYPLHVFQGGRATLTLQALPTHEINARHSLTSAVAIDGGTPQTLEFAHGNHEQSRIWQQNVLRNAMTATAELEIGPGAHTLTVFGLDPSIVLDQIRITFQPVAPAYLGPRQTRYTPDVD